MADNYSEAASRWTIHTPSNTGNLIQSLTAFINDVNLFVSQNSNISDHKFLTLAQQDIHRWQGILQSTGRELNTKKCFWSDFNPQFDQNGTPSISGPNLNQTPLYLTNPDDTPDIMCNTTSNEAIQHLGVHIHMDGNQKTEEKMLLKCCRMFKTIYLQCPFTQCKAAIVYSTIFLPTITYPFPATTLSRKIHDHTQNYQ